MRIAALFLLAFVACDMSQSRQPVTLAVVNARVWTGNPNRPWADAIAVSGERLTAVGSSAEIRKLAGNAELIDANGQFLVPG
ncbi:MAG: amidohydrolase, partial [Gemmatimonadota bacterium]